MGEVECRTCLEMSDLNNSISIARKFLLEKSFQEVILLFAPQMSTAIWYDDIVCFTCSKIFNTFAQFIERIVAIEKGLRNINKPIKNVRGSTTIVGHFNKDTVINRESLELYAQYEDKIRLQPKPKQELKERPSQSVINGDMEYSHDQSASSSQSDTLRKLPKGGYKVRCRTCLLAMSSLEPSTNLTEKFLLGTTFKELILYFVPHMVPVSCMDELICSNCSKTLHDFAEFIKRIITIEEICKKIDNCTTEDIDSQLNTNGSPQINSHVPTSRHKINRRHELRTAKDPGTRRDHPIKPPPNQPHFNSDKPIWTYSRKSKIKEEVVELSNKEEPTTPLNQPIFNIGRDYQETSTTQLSDMDEEIVLSIKKQNQHVTSRVKQKNTLKDIPPCDSTASINKDSTIHTEVEISTANDYHEENEAEDLNKQLIKEDSSRCYPIHFHDRIVSVQNNEHSTFLEDISMQDIQIYHYGPPKDMENKRILLFGSLMVPCPICKAEFTSTALRRHMKMKHETDLLRFQSDSSYSCILRPSKTNDLSESEDNMFYIYDGISGPTNSKQIHPCPHCKTVANSDKLLIKHVQRLHKGLSPYKCKKCDKTFRRKLNYTLHVRKFQNFPNCDGRNCHVCFKMVSRENFTSHVKAHHSFICEKCGCSCLSEYYLKKHSRTHHDERCEETNKQRQLCPICGKLVAQVAAHMKTHEIRPRTYMCDKCSKCFVSLTHLNKHIMSSHHNVELQCEHCKRKYKSVNSLKEHIKLKHSRTYSHSCKICGAQFSRGDYLRRHMKNHSKGRSFYRNTGRYSYASGKSTSVTCKYCSKSFSTVYQLRPHLLTHVKRMRYKCRVCGITCSNLQNRHRHENKHKDPTFALRCKICWNYMKTKEELEMHMEIHENSKKYECQYCEEAFARRYLLSHHISEEHTDKEEVEIEKEAILYHALEEFLVQ